MNTVLVEPIRQNMSAAEARVCVQRIRDGIGTVRQCLVELRDRKGWKALGYASLKDCVAAEFGLEKSQLYEELQAAEVEENLAHLEEKSGIPEKPTGWLPASQARALADLDPEQQREVYQSVVANKGEGVTAKDLHDAKVELLFRQLSPEQQKKIIDDEEAAVEAKEKAKDKPTTGKFMKIQGYLGKILTSAAKLQNTAASFGEDGDPVLEEIRLGLAHFERAKELLPKMDPEG